MHFSFKQYCNQAHCVENLLFYEGIQRYRAAESSQQRVAIGRDLHDKYVSLDGETVNLPGPVVKALGIVYQKGDYLPETFNPAEEVTLRMLRTDSFMAFRKTPRASYVTVDSAGVVVPYYFIAFLEAIAQRKEFLQKYLAEEAPDAFKSMLPLSERANLFLWLELKYLLQGPESDWPVKLKDIEETYLKHRSTVLSYKLVTSLSSNTKETYLKAQTYLFDYLAARHVGKLMSSDQRNNKRADNILKSISGSAFFLAPNLDVPVHSISVENLRGQYLKTYMKAVHHMMTDRTRFVDHQIKASFDWVPVDVFYALFDVPLAKFTTLDDGTVTCEIDTIPGIRQVFGSLYRKDKEGDSFVLAPPCFISFDPTTEQIEMELFYTAL